MGIYIRGMEMPISEEKCKFYQSAPFRLPYCPINGVCNGLEGCPLVSVPLHGDLIDRNALLEKHYGRFGQIDEVAREAIKAAAVIIPASDD